MDSFRFDENTSPRLAPRMLVNPGYRYLTAAEA